MNESKTRQRPPFGHHGEMPSPSERANLLLIDDQPTCLLSYETILSGLGVRRVRASSGQLAVARVLRGLPRNEQTPMIFAIASRQVTASTDACADCLGGAAA